MIYGVQVFDQTPRAIAKIDLSESQYETLNAPSLTPLTNATRVALKGAGVTLKEPMHVTLRAMSVTAVKDCSMSIEEAEQRERWDSLEGPHSDEARIVVSVLQDFLKPEQS